MKRPPRSLCALPPRGSVSSLGRPGGTAVTTSDRSGRRHFLQRTGALAALGLGGVLDVLDVLDVIPAADAQGASDYKALVCVFQFGGNDGNNTIVPLDSAGYAQYAAVRSAASGLQLGQAELLPIALAVFTNALPDPAARNCFSAARRALLAALLL